MWLKSLKDILDVAKTVIKKDEFVYIVFRKMKNAMTNLHLDGWKNTSKVKLSHFILYIS